MERDVWLVMGLEPGPRTSNQSNFEFPLPSTQKIILNRQNYRYTMPIAGVDGPGGELVLTLPAPKDSSQKEDLETLEVILAQYAVLQTQEDTAVTPLGGAPPDNPNMTGGGGIGEGGYGDGDLKGRLVLVDEGNGQVVGMLDDRFNIREDAGMHAAGSEKDPVVVEIPEEEDEPSVESDGEEGISAKRETFVYTIPVDDSDWISQTAGFLRYVPLTTPTLSHYAILY
jgi:spartin